MGSATSHQLFAAPSGGGSPPYPPDSREPRKPRGGVGAVAIPIVAQLRMWSRRQWRMAGIRLLVSFLLRGSSDETLPGASVGRGTPVERLTCDLMPEAIGHVTLWARNSSQVRRLPACSPVAHSGTNKPPACTRLSPGSQNFIRTRWPGFAALHSGHVTVVEFISAVWRRLRSFALCVGGPRSATPCGRVQRGSGPNRRGKARE